MTAILGVIGITFLGGLVLGPLVLLVMAFWLWMLVDAIVNKGLSDVEKICWVLAILFLHILGAILYFFIGHPKRKPPIAAS